MHVGARARPTASAAVARLRHLAALAVTESGVSVETHLAFGNAVRELSALAHKLDADVVVVPNPETNLVQDLLRLNTALRVQRRTERPVLAVSSAALRPYTTVLFLADLSVGSAHAARRAIDLFPAAEVVLLHAFEAHYAGMLTLASATEEVVEEYGYRAQVEGMERLRAFAHANCLAGKTTLRVRLGHAALAARREADALGADVVVLQPSKSWHARGVTDPLISNPPCDLLLMP